MPQLAPPRYVLSLRDGRQVCLRGARVRDVTAPSETSLATRHAAIERFSTLRAHAAATDYARRLAGTQRG